MLYNERPDTTDAPALNKPVAPVLRRVNRVTFLSTQLSPVLSVTTRPRLLRSSAPPLAPLHSGYSRCAFCCSLRQSHTHIQLLGAPPIRPPFLSPWHRRGGRQWQLPASRTIPSSLLPPLFRDLYAARDNGYGTTFSEVGGSFYGSDPPPSSPSPSSDLSSSSPPSPLSPLDLRDTIVARVSASFVAITLFLLLHKYFFSLLHQFFFLMLHFYSSGSRSKGCFYCCGSFWML